MFLREKFIEFYKGTDYSVFRKTTPRPSEWHIPIHIYNELKDFDEIFIEEKKENKIMLFLDYERMLKFRITLLHESIFNYYKAFYNYLAAKNLYQSGAKHWIEITGYYAKLYLARAINILSGQGSYYIKKDDYYCIDKVLEVLGDNGKKRNAYSIRINFDFLLEEGSIVFEKRGVNSHADIWKTYGNIKLEGLGLSKITSEGMFGNDIMHLSNQRNKENYSFNGYNQVDFNLEVGNFKDYFRRDHIKRKSNLVFDETLGIVLGVITELYNLYNSLLIENLPLELEKHRYMVSYMVYNEDLKMKLLDLISREFRDIEKYLKEMNDFYAQFYA